jgi:hypothetical protein
LHDPRDAHELAQEFRRKTCSNVMINSAGNSVVDAMRFR